MNVGTNTGHQGATWTQVGHGTIEGNIIDLRWSDVPYGAIRTNGRIRLRIEADTLLSVISDDGPFGNPEFRSMAPEEGGAQLITPGIMLRRMS